VKELNIYFYCLIVQIDEIKFMNDKNYRKYCLNIKLSKLIFLEVSSY